MLYWSSSRVNKVFFLFVFIFLLFLPQYGIGYKTSDFNWIPPFLARDEMPSITIVLDNSGSMGRRAYNETGLFDPMNEYYGYFDSELYYNYINTAGSQHFVPHPSGAWNGNFLNWATMHRMDVSRKVLTGGKYDATNGWYVLHLNANSANQASSYTFSYDDTSQVVTFNGTTAYMTPHRGNLTIRLPLDQNYVRFRIGSSATNYDYILHVKGPKKTGVLHDFKDKARLGLFVFRTYDGGRIRHYMSEKNETEFNNFCEIINTTNAYTSTPLAETLHTVYGYLRQVSCTTTNTNGPRYNSECYSCSSAATPDPYPDPYFFKSFNSLIPCTQQSVILITDGAPTQDTAIPSALQNIVTRPRPTADYGGYSTFLIDIAYKAQTDDLRSLLSGNQTLDFYAVAIFDGDTYVLRDAARFGKFNDLNNNNLPDLQGEYDNNNDGIPDNYYAAQSGEEIEAAIRAVFQLATAGRASGTAAAVTSQTRSGEGAAYQALFFPPSSNQIAPTWSGQVHSFLLDAHGNMREDTNGNGRLDLKIDRIVRFEGDQVFVSTDLDGNGDINAAETNSTPLGSVNDINYLWSTSPWLNSMTNAQASFQRTYGTLSNNRHIFTFVDKNNNMIPDIDEVVPFSHTTNPCNNDNYFCSYLTLYGNNTMAVSPPVGLSLAQLSDLSQRQINFIRGVDVGNATIGTVQDITRSRSIDGGPTWRLGDIIYSSPTVVGKPAENYHLTYQDKTYEAFFKKYRNRRQVIYTGSNDGMLHAFNSGFYNSTALDQFARGAFQLSWTNGEIAFPLGAELWAYVPYNLLPHLKWLMDKDYGENLHAAYMDLKPRIFDARVFFQADGITPSNNSTHPNGWGTILVAGMRLGGAQIGVDINKDGTADRNATSAYVVMDITNPEQAPTLLGEISMPGQGFTTCYPTVMPMSKRNANTAADNQWYLVFGSGPAKLIGSQGVADRSVLGLETSNQNGRLFVLDLKALVAEKALKSINSSGVLVTGGSVFATTEAGSFISDPVAVDLNIGPYASPGEFKADVVYYGTVSGDRTTGQGTLRRLLTNNSLTSTAWTGNSIFINVGKPVTSAPSVTVDDSSPRRLWVYFGTGRFYNREDIPQTAHMAFYGVKEPIFANGTKSWSTVTVGLFNSTDVILDNSTCGGVNTQDCVRVYKSGSLMSGASAAGSWKNLTDAVTNATGWRLDFNAAYERVLGQAALLGGALLFTSYTPSNDVCSFEGTSKLWGLYYKTGTAYFKPILGATGSTLNTSVDLGQGMALTPNIHVGEKGATAFVQSSTGAVQTIKIETPESVRSGTLFWRKNVE